LNKKKDNTKITPRELNSFPYLNMTLQERLRLSGSIDLTDNFKIVSETHYIKITPLDKSKKHK